MMYYEYFEYQKQGRILFEGFFENILKADEAFKKEIGKDPAKVPSYGVRVIVRPDPWWGAKVW